MLDLMLEARNLIRIKVLAVYKRAPFCLTPALSLQLENTVDQLRSFRNVRTLCNLLAFPFFFFLKNSLLSILFNWTMIVLQCCAGF